MKVVRFTAITTRQMEGVDPQLPSAAPSPPAAVAASHPELEYILFISVGCC